MLFKYTFKNSILCATFAFTNAFTTTPVILYIFVFTRSRILNRLELKRVEWLVCFFGTVHDSTELARIYMTNIIRT